MILSALMLHNHTAIFLTIVDLIVYLYNDVLYSLVLGRAIIIGHTKLGSSQIKQEIDRFCAQPPLSHDCSLLFLYCSLYK